ncbi:MAG: hypothetical protein RLZZ630_968 [Bacteroidota bacterium]
MVVVMVLLKVVHTVPLGLTEELAQVATLVFSMQQVIHVGQEVVLLFADVQAQFGLVIRIKGL